MGRWRIVWTMSLLAIVSSWSSAQGSANRANWELANRFTAANMQLWTGSSTLSPSFIGKTNKFWYRWRDATGARFMLVEPDAKRKAPLFDHAQMAADLSEMTKKPYDAVNLPFTTIDFDESGKFFKFQVESKRFRYDLDSKKLSETKPDKTPEQLQAEAAEYRTWSPDKKSFVYTQNHNLFLVTVDDKKKESDPVQLTTDGVEYYSYGSSRSSLGGDSGLLTDKAKKFRAPVTWSEDSKRFFLIRVDSRKVKDLWLVNALSEPRPTLQTYKYAMPGDEFVSQMELYVYSRVDNKLTRAKVEKYKDQRLQNLHWPNTSDHLRYIRRDRLQRNMELVDLDMNTGFERVLITESVENAFLETRPIKYVKDGGDFLWWSERTGWGHLYLYSFDGKLKNVVTRGAWRVENVDEVDADKGQVWYTAVGKDPSRNPYYVSEYRCKLDGTDDKELTAGDASHTSSLSPDKKYIVDSFSRIDQQPRVVLRNANGDSILDLEAMDLSRLLEAGWKAPSAFKVKSADGVTDIYGNMWKPFDFDPKRKYPIILNVYPGPQTESVNADFLANAGVQQLAQLGFIVIQVGNRGGNPQRSNAYHSYGYYNLRDYGLADKKAAVEQLAAKYPWIDIDKVGIYGHSGGGFMTAAAMLLPPYNDFFKVGVSSSGNHDNNIYNQNWSEQHHGLREVQVKAAGAKPEGEPDDYDMFDAPQETKFEIKVPTTVELAPNLKGKLLLVTGDMDDNVHPGNTVRLVNALIKANKRFDFMIMPGQQHGYGPMTGYFTARLQEYFAEHLLGDYYGATADAAVKK